MNNQLHYFRHPLLLLLAGLILRTMGAAGMVMHWQGAKNLRHFAMIVMVIALIWLMVKMSSAKKEKP